MSVCQGVLIVEDDDAIRYSLSELIRSEGYLVHTARNGKEALEIIPGLTCPTLILTDLMMPELSGWDLLKRVRADDRLAQLPIIVMSAVADYHDLSAANAVIKKPYNLEAVLKAVREHCGEAPGSLLQSTS